MQLSRAEIFRVEPRDRGEEINCQIFDAGIVFVEPVLPSRIARRVPRATKPTLVADDEPAVKSA